MFKVLISDSLSSLANEIFEKNNIEVDTITNLSPEELKKIINNYDGLVVRSATKATDVIISAGTKLKIIGRAGAGVDNIDIISAKKKNIIVMNTPGANTNATAEHSLSLLISVYKNIPLANSTTHDGLWEKKKFKGLELKGKKIGIIGFGNVGMRLAEISISLGMEVNVFSNSFESRKSNFPNIKSLSFKDLITHSDIVSLHCKPNKDNKPLFSYNEFKLMKSDSVLINTARGGLIDEDDLKKALEENLIRGAGLDVYKDEPLKDSILFDSKNLILTPHIAASTIEAQVIVAEKIANQISDYFNNGNIKNSI